MPRLALSPVPPERADADLLVLPVAAGTDGPAAPTVTAAVLERLGAGLDTFAGGATGPSPPAATGSTSRSASACSGGTGDRARRGIACSVWVSSGRRAQS